MKKVLLLGASALALGAGSTAAFADDPVKVTLSGTGQEWFGYATNNKTDLGGADSKLFAASNNSFSLNGTTKLDNGITVGVSFSMNASPGTEGSQAHVLTTSGKLNQTQYAVGTGSPETNIITFAGSFGQVAIGWQPNASLSAISDAPYLGVAGLSWARWSGWVKGPSSSNLVAGSGQTATYDDYWANKVVYSSPTWNGVQISASFTPDMAAADGAPTATSGGSTGNWGGSSEAVALTYGGDFGSAKVKAAFAWTGEGFNGQATPGGGLSNGQGGHVNGYQGSLNVTVGGFTVGAAVNDRVVGQLPTNSVSAYDLKTALADGITWDVGAQYKSGPWAVAINYYASQADDNGNNTAAATGKADVHMYGAQFEYTLGPGIALDWENGIIAYHVDPGANADKNSGFYSLLSTTVNF